MEPQHIRNFCIIAHIDHGKSTLADRLLELTGTVEKRKMKEQLLDAMDLERERGITIKLAPVRMTFTPRTVTDMTPTVADNLLYKDLTYKIRGAVFAVRKQLGLGHKESVYGEALKMEFQKIGLHTDKEKTIDVIYEGKKVGVYRPDFIVEQKIIVELKALPYIGRNEETQLWHYLRGTSYRLALLVNFGVREAIIQRVIYDEARDRSIPPLSASGPQLSAYLLNLIDTPGHVDFTYEVSRSLAAVEGAILLVDATQGVQAQTIANLYLAIEQNLTIIPVINKIDLPNADIEKTTEEIMHLLGCAREDILRTSGKTGEGVPELLEAVIARIPPPRPVISTEAKRSGEISPDALLDGVRSLDFARDDNTKSLRALIFDSFYDDYRGVVASVRILDGTLKKNDPILLMRTGAQASALEVGHYAPALTEDAELSVGQIGYVVTGMKELGKVRVGDTVTRAKNPAQEALPGYKEVKPMVFAGIFPKEGDAYGELRDGILKLKLSDSALSFEPEHSKALGFGFRCGFLGMLHLDIFQERLRREFDVEIVATVPSVAYHIKKTNGETLVVKSPQELPDPSYIADTQEPWMTLDIITPDEGIGNVMGLVSERKGRYLNTEYLSVGSGRRAILHYEIPLSSLITDFYDKLKTVTSGYASMNYEFKDYRQTDVVRLDILVAEEPVEALSTLVWREDAFHVGKKIVESLKETLPKQQFELKIQAAIGGKIIAAERLSALRKDVLAKLSGGDVTRKRKLLEKQKKGKKRRASHGRGSVDIPPEAYLAVLKR